MLSVCSVYKKRILSSDNEKTINDQSGIYFRECLMIQQNQRFLCVLSQPNAYSMGHVLVRLSKQALYLLHANSKGLVIIIRQGRWSGEFFVIAT